MARKIPTLSTELIEELDKNYPSITPQDVLNHEREELVILATQRRMIEVLRYRLEHGEDDEE